MERRQKLQRIRRVSEFREEENARKCLHTKRSYSSCSNREEKIKTSGIHGPIDISYAETSLLPIRRGGKNSAGEIYHPEIQTKCEIRSSGTPIRGENIDES